MRFLSILLLLFAIETHSQPAGNNSYYFSPDSFFIPKTLTFVNTNDPEDLMIWEMRTIVSNGDANLHTDIFRNSMLTESLIERIENGSAKMISYILYNGSSNAVCTIVDSSIYQSGLSDSAKIQWKVSFADFNSGRDITLTKIRQLLSTTKEYEIFHDAVTMNFPGSTNAYSYTIESTYEKGKGLTALKLNIPGQKLRSFVLTGTVN